MPDYAPVKTLEAWANQINTKEEAQVMGVHHSEGRPVNAEYFGRADVSNTPARVVELSDGHNGLYVDTKLLANDPGTPGIIKDFESPTININSPSSGNVFGVSAPSFNVRVTEDYLA